MNHLPCPGRRDAREARGAPRPTLAMLGLAMIMAATIAARPAHGSVTLKSSTKFDYGIAVRANYNQGSTQFNVNTEAGRFTTTWKTTDSNVNPHISWTGNSFLTYCVDIATFLQPNQEINAQVSVTNGASTDAKGVIRDLGAAGWVFNTFGQKKNQTDAQWLNFLGTLAVPGGFAGPLSMAQAHAALQLAIWEAAYDPNGGKSGNLGYLGAGALTFSGQAVQFGTNSDPKNRNVVRLVNFMLDARGGKTSSIGFINYPPNGLQATPTNQDQLFQAVPEPSSLALTAIAGLIGLGVVGRKRLATRTGQH